MLYGDIRPMNRRRPVDTSKDGTGPMPFGPGAEENEQAGVVDEILGRCRGKSGVYPYDDQVANLLCTASAWAYSDARALSSMMDRRGLPDNYCHYINVLNDAMFVCSTAYLIQSECGRMAILCFRGTEPTNIINWMTDFSFSVDRFYSIGHIHGGFNRNVSAIWPYIVPYLDEAIDGRPIFTASNGAHTNGAHANGEPNGASNGGNGHAHPRKMKELEALYFTGHSLGAAMATVAAAIVHQDPRYAKIRKALRGVYTFGQPMVGDEEFTKNCEKDFGHMLFRHVYGVDVVTRMPAITMGKFKHFGREYISSDSGWVENGTPAHAVTSMVVSTVVAGTAWVMKQVPMLSRVKLPVSFDDHSPLYYQRCCRLPRPGSEFE
jgi:hypothetical protein